MPGAPCFQQYTMPRFLFAYPNQSRAGRGIVVKVVVRRQITAGTRMARFEGDASMNSCVGDWSIIPFAARTPLSIHLAPREKIWGASPAAGIPGGARPGFVGAC